MLIQRRRCVGSLLLLLFCRTLFLPQMMATLDDNDNHHGTGVPALHHRLLQETERLQEEETPSFLGHPVAYHEPSKKNAAGEMPFLVSVAHCVGENYHVDSWMYRYCQFRNLCWDTETHEFLLFPSPEELALLEQLEQLSHPDLVTISSVSGSDRSAARKMLPLGSIHDDPWSSSSGADPIHRNQWYPNVVKDPANRGYYQLPPDTVLFPVRLSETHVQLWDDLFAIYTVLASFGWEDKKLILFPVHLENAEAVHELWNHWGPALGLTFSGDSVNSSVFPQLKNADDKQSRLVCAKYAAAGLGMIASTRHQTDASSQQEQILTHAVGRAGAYRSFRAFLWKRLNLSDSNEPSPYLVGILVQSDAAREEIAATMQSMGKFQTQMLDPWTASIDQQAALAASSKILVVDMSNLSAVLVGATFLPERSLLLVLENDNYDHGHRDHRHVRDVLELMGHFRLYWPRNTEDISQIVRKENGSLG